MSREYWVKRAFHGLDITAAGSRGVEEKEKGKEKKKETPFHIKGTYEGRFWTFGNGVTRRR